MRRWSMRRSSKSVQGTVGWVLLLTMTWLGQSVQASGKERDPITLSVVAVNPSAEKPQTVPIRIDLPQEVKPHDVLEQGELTLEYDDDRSLYYVYKDAVALAPKETRVFEVTLRDVWLVPDEQIDSLKQYTGTLLGKLKGSEYYESARQLGDSVLQRLEGIATTQNDETLSRKSHIGAYRMNLQALERVKEDLARMEKLLTFTGGPPVPEMLEESPLKADAPSTTTTWLVIFLVMVFLGLLGGQFFFTWHRRSQVTQDLHVVRQAAFNSSRAPGQGGPARAAPSGAPGGASRANGSPPSR